MKGDPQLTEGWIDVELAAELPGLRLVAMGAASSRRRSPPGVREQLAAIAARIHGARALTMRREPVAEAYRVCFRQLGLDPDVVRPPGEAAVLERLAQGGIRSHGLPADALALALLETGVPLWALDESALSGPLGLRPARVGERIGAGELAADVPPGRIVVADADRPLAVLFGDPAPSARPGRHTRALRIFAIAVAGVSQLHVEEALFTCAELLHDGAESG